jgi:membrane carboxypeptidase/penicillin-binding protein
MGFNRPFAGKTGTTNNYRDAWFVGYSPRILTLVWVGFDDGTSLRMSGGDACLPIWVSHMNRIRGLLPDVEWKRPDDVTSREIDPESGQLASPYCPASRREIFVAGTEPGAVCALHAGSGEPSPFWRDYDPDLERRPRDGEEDENVRAERERRARERENSIRKLLRRIFGDN